ncbi:MAG: TonB family protein, partial [Mucilaginibacter sp.]
VDKNLYVVYEYDKSGKVMLVTSSKTNDINLKYHGHYIVYYPNGRRMKMGTLADGLPVGQETSYYPNGNVYTVKNYISKDINLSESKREFLSECRDSTGLVLAARGNGKWIIFDAGFKYITAEGKLANGARDSLWRVRNKGYVVREDMYKNGRLLSGINVGRFNEAAPEFPGGLAAFGKFIEDNIVYPVAAHKNGTKGKVVVSFVIEEDGSLTGGRVVKGIGDGCDEEALRVIKRMPKWKPAVQNGKSVRVAYNVPITFGLTN